MLRQPMPLAIAVGAVRVDRHPGDLAHALAWGCACGALSTRAAGGTAAQAGPEEAAALAARIQVGADLLGSV
jgi:hypothetical protein